MKRLLTLILLALAFTVTGQAQAEPKSAPPEVKVEPLTPDETLKLLTILNLEGEIDLYNLAPTPAISEKNVAAKLTQLYREAASNPRLMREIVARHMEKYLARRTGIRSAPQASQVADEAAIDFLSLLIAQNSAIIEQNHRIINLLEQLVHKR